MALEPGERRDESCAYRTQAACLRAVSRFGRDRPASVTAISLLVLGLSLLAVTDGMAKLLGRDHHVLQITWARFTFYVIPMILLVDRGCWCRLIPSGKRRLLLAQAFLPLLVSALMIASVRFLPLAKVTAVFFTTTFFVTIFSVFILAERTRWQIWIAVFCGFVGVAIILRPEGGMVSWAVLLPLAAAYCSALYHLTIRLLGNCSDPILLLIHSGLVGSVLTTCTLPFVWRDPSLSSWALMVAFGAISGLALFLCIVAFTMAAASTLAPFIYTRIVAAFVFGLLVFGEYPDLTSLIGAGVIVSSGIYVFRQERSISGRQ